MGSKDYLMKTDGGALCLHHDILACWELGKLFICYLLIILMSIKKSTNEAITSNML